MIWEKGRTEQSNFTHSQLCPIFLVRAIPMDFTSILILSMIYFTDTNKNLFQENFLPATLSCLFIQNHVVRSWFFSLLGFAEFWNSSNMEIIVRFKQCSFFRKLCPFISTECGRLKLSKLYLKEIIREAATEEWLKSGGMTVS